MKCAWFHRFSMIHLRVCWRWHACEIPIKLNRLLFFLGLGCAGCESQTPRRQSIQLASLSNNNRKQQENWIRRREWPKQKLFLFFTAYQNAVENKIENNENDEEENIVVVLINWWRQGVGSLVKKDASQCCVIGRFFPRPRLSSSPQSEWWTFITVRSCRCRSRSSFLSYIFSVGIFFRLGLAVGSRRLSVAVLLSRRGRRLPLFHPHFIMPFYQRFASSHRHLVFFLVDSLVNYHCIQFFLVRFTFFLFRFFFSIFDFPTQRRRRRHQAHSSPPSERSKKSEKVVSLEPSILLLFR